MMLKKLITIGALILCLISPTTVKAEELKEMYVTANSGLNIREKETTESEIIKALPKGTKVEITSTDNPEWYAIKYEDIEGYMYSKWLSEEEPNSCFCSNTEYSISGKIVRNMLHYSLL